MHQYSENTAPALAPLALYLAQLRFFTLLCGLPVKHGLKTNALGEYFPAHCIEGC